MDLYLFRHGKAEREGPDGSDTTRPLTSRGRRETSAAALWMGGQDLSFDLIATSPARRAYGTADIIARDLGLLSQLATWESLATTGDEGEVAAALEQYEGEGPILLVGHEPTLSNLAAYLIGLGAGGGIHLAKGGLIRLSGDIGDGPGSWEIRWLLTPAMMSAGQ